MIRSKLTSVEVGVVEAGFIWHGWCHQRSLRKDDIFVPISVLCMILIVLYTKQINFDRCVMSIRSSDFTQGTRHNQYNQKRPVDTDLSEFKTYSLRFTIKLLSIESKVTIIYFLYQTKWKLGTRKLDVAICTILFRVSTILLYSRLLLNFYLIHCFAFQICHLFAK